MTRHEDDTRAGIRGAAASLAQIATQLTDAVAEPGETRTVAGLVHVNAQRAALACLSLAAHGGRLEALAVVRADAIAAERAALEAEAERDAEMYEADRGTSDTYPEPREWAAGAFADTWEEGGALDRDAAWSVYLAAFMRGSSRRSNPRARPGLRRLARVARGKCYISFLHPERDVSIKYQ